MPRQREQTDVDDRRGFMGRSDWEVVMLPPVQPEPGWQEYFAVPEPQRAAA